MVGDPAYALNKLYDATDELARGTGGAKERLFDALRLLVGTIGREDFPEPLGAEFDAIMNEIEQRRVDLPFGYSRYKMGSVTAARLIRRLLELRDRLEEAIEASAREV